MRYSDPSTSAASCTLDARGRESGASASGGPAGPAGTTA